MNWPLAMNNFLKGCGIRFLFFLLIWASVVGCRNEGSENERTSPLQQIHPDTLADYLDYASRALSEHEEERIDQYVARHELNLISTPSGLRYRVFVPGEGPNAQPGDLVVFNYSLRLINGILITDSDKEGPMEILVGKGEMVSGLHELLQYMNRGARARAIIPSRLAYGFTGDQERIPKGATLIYDVEILTIKQIH